MEHALALARKGTGLASPNPHVGCLIVRDGQIVGERLSITEPTQPPAYRTQWTDITPSASDAPGEC